MGSGNVLWCWYQAGCKLWSPGKESCVWPSTETPPLGPSWHFSFSENIPTCHLLNASENYTDSFILQAHENPVCQPSTPGCVLCLPRTLAKCCFGMCLRMGWIKLFLPDFLSFLLWRYIASISAPMRVVQAAEITKLFQVIYRNRHCCLVFLLFADETPSVRPSETGFPPHSWWHKGVWPEPRV